MDNDNRRRKQHKEITNATRDTVQMIKHGIQTGKRKKFDSIGEHRRDKGTEWGEGGGVSVTLKNLCCGSEA